MKNLCVNQNMSIVKCVFYSVAIVVWAFLFPAHNFDLMSVKESHSMSCLSTNFNTFLCALFLGFYFHNVTFLLARSHTAVRRRRTATGQPVFSSSLPLNCRTSLFLACVNSFTWSLNKPTVHILQSSLDGIANQETRSRCGTLGVGQWHTNGRRKFSTTLAFSVTAKCNRCHGYAFLRRQIKADEHFC